MDQRPTGIVTPEAVVLEFETAGVGSRGVAKLIDLLLQFFTLLVLLFVVAFAASSASGGTVAVVVYLVLSFLIIVGYPIAIESLWNGKSVGKWALGLRVMTREGAPTRFRHSAIRGIFQLVEILALPVLAVMSCVLTRDNQRFGDLAAGTIVIRERKAKGQHAAVSFPPPPGLEAYVASLDITGLRAEQYQVVRSFLMRVLELTPSVRAAMAVRLANPVAVQLHHDPPPYLGPELYLACIASAYQRHHGGPAAAWVPDPAVAAPGYVPAGPGGYAPGYGAPGYGAPAYGAPAYGAQAYGAQAYGAPGYGPGVSGPPGAAAYGPTASDPTMYPELAGVERPAPGPPGQWAPADPARAGYGYADPAGAPVGMAGGPSPYPAYPAGASPARPAAGPPPPPPPPPAPPPPAATPPPPPAPPAVPLARAEYPSSPPEQPGPGDARPR